MVVLSAKFTILILWHPFRIPLILSWASMTLGSMSATIMDNSIESGDPWLISDIMVKGSDRRPFILILE